MDISTKYLVEVWLKLLITSVNSISISPESVLSTAAMRMSVQQEQKIEKIKTPMYLVKQLVLANGAKYIWK